MTSADHGNLFLQKKINGAKDEFKSQQQRPMQMQDIFDIESIKVEVLRTEISTNININCFQPSFSLQLGNQTMFNSINQYRDPFNAIYNEIFEFDCSNMQQMNKLIMKLYHVNQLPQQQNQNQFINKIQIGQCLLDTLTVQAQQTNKKEILSQDKQVIGYVYYKIQIQHNGIQNNMQQKQLNILTNQASYSQFNNNNNAAKNNSNFSNINNNNISPKPLNNRLAQMQDDSKKRMKTDNTVQTNYQRGYNPEKELYRKMLEENDNDQEHLIDFQGHIKKKSFDDLDQSKRREQILPHRQLNCGNTKERVLSQAPDSNSQGHHHTQMHMQQQSSIPIPVSQFHSQKVNQVNSNRAFKMLIQNNGKQLKQQLQNQQTSPMNNGQQMQNTFNQQQQSFQQQQQQIQQSFQQQQQFQQQLQQQPHIQQNIVQNNQLQVQQQQQPQQQQQFISQKSQDVMLIPNNPPIVIKQSSKNTEQQQQIQQSPIIQPLQPLQQQQQQQMQMQNISEQALLAQQQEAQRMQLEIADFQAKILLDEQRLQTAIQNINILKKQLEDERVATKVKNDCLVENLQAIENESYQYDEYFKVVKEEDNVIKEQIKVVLQSIKEKKKSIMIKRAESKILARQQETKIKKLDLLYERIKHYEKNIKITVSMNEKQQDKVSKIDKLTKKQNLEKQQQMKIKRRSSLQDKYSAFDTKSDDDFLYSNDPLRNISHLLDEKNEERQMYFEAIKTYQNLQDEYTHMIQMEQTVKEKLQNLQEKLSELGIQESTLNDRTDLGEDKTYGDQYQQSLFSEEGEQHMAQNHIYFRQNDEYQDQKDFHQQIRNMQIKQLMLEDNSYAYGNENLDQNNSQEQHVSQNFNQLINNTNAQNGQSDNNQQQLIKNFLQVQSSQRPQRVNNLQQQLMMQQQYHNLSQQVTPLQQQNQQLTHTHSAVIPNHYELTFKSSLDKASSFSNSNPNGRYENQRTDQNDEQQLIINDGIQTNQYQRQQQNQLYSQRSFQGQHNQTKSNQEKLQQINVVLPSIQIEGPSFEQHIQSVTARNSPRISNNQQSNFHFQPIKSSGQLLQLQQLQNNSNNSNNNSANNIPLQNAQNSNQQIEEVGSFRNKPNRYEQKSVDIIYTQQSPYSLLNQQESTFTQQQQQAQSSQYVQRPITPINKKNKSDINQIQIIKAQSNEIADAAASPEFSTGKNNNSNNSSNTSFNNSRMLFTQIVGQAQQQQQLQQQQQQQLQQQQQSSQNSNSSLNERDYSVRYGNKSFDNINDQRPQQLLQQNYQNSQQIQRGYSHHEQTSSSNINNTQQIQQQIQQQVQVQQPQSYPQQVQQKSDQKTLREQYKAKQMNQQQQLKQNNNNIQNYQNINDLNQVFQNTAPTLFGQYFNSRITQQDQQKQ